MKGLIFFIIYVSIILNIRYIFLMYDICTNECILFKIVLIYLSMLMYWKFENNFLFPSI